MSKILRISTIPALVLASTFSFADAMSTETAKQHVEEYRELRKQCTVATLAKKQACFRELTSMTPTYKSAKNVLAARHGQQTILLGYAQ